MKPQIANAKVNSLLKKGKFIKIALLIASVMTVSLLSGSLYFRDRVYITDNGITKELMISESDINEILDFGGYTIGEHDRISFETDENSIAHITIHRAFDVIIKADGDEIIVPVISGTVEEIIETANITLGEFDLVDLDMTQELTEETTITITRVAYKLRENTSEIPYEVQYIENSNMVIGEERVAVEGENGIRSYFVEEKYVDGVLVSQELTEESITKQPVTKIVERGTALAEPYAKMSDPEALSLINGIPAEYTRVISGKSTAYTAGYNSLTASGRKAEIGTVAVNPNVIPYGSELYIVSQDGKKVYGYAIAADTGLGLMDGTVAVDLYFGNRYDYYDDSCRWGAVQVDIYVLTEGEGY